MLEAVESNGAGISTQSRLVTMATCFLLFFGGVLVRSTLDGNLTSLVKEYNEEYESRRLQNEPRQFDYADDLTDQHLERFNMVEVHFRNKAHPERNQKLFLKVEGFDRFPMAEHDEEGIHEEYVFGYLNNTDYHSIQLLRATHNVTGPVKHRQRRKLLWNLVNDFKRKTENAWNDVRNLGSWIRDKRNAIANGIRDAANIKKWWNEAKGAATTAWNKVTNLKNEVTKFTGDIFNWKKWLAEAKKKATSGWNEVTDITKKVADLAKKLADIPNLIKTKIIDPVDRDIRKVFTDVIKIDSIAKFLADNTVKAIKQLNFLPTSGTALANLLKKSLLGSFANGICVPYQMLAGRFKLDLSNIELYKNSFATISTQVTPSTCLDISKIQFDISKLGGFLNIFKNLDALKGIYDKVKEFVQKIMKEIIGFADDIKNIFNKIESTVDGALGLIGLRRLEQSWDEAGNKVSGDELVEQAELGHYSNLTLGDAQIIAYHAGRMKFEQLYGEHVRNVFQEHRVLANGKSFIGFTALELRLRANFKQDITLEAAKRTGFADSIFDETLHQSVTAPVPFTAGLLNIVASGSVEGSMPYALTLDATGKAVFGYEVGQVTATVDVVNQKFTFDKQPFTTKSFMDAQVGLSGYMALKFGASASLGICLGPTQDACLTVSIDSKQETAAGFDAWADLSLGQQDKPFQLESMYQDKIAYPPKDCKGNIRLSAGYWQYVMTPSVDVSLTGTSFDDLNLNLFNYPAKIIQSSIKNFCVAIPFSNRRLGEYGELLELPEGEEELFEEHRQLLEVGPPAFELPEPGELPFEREVEFLPEDSW